MLKFIKSKPSRPTEKRDGARGETLLERTPVHTPKTAHKERPGHTNGHDDKTSHDLRDMCNKMYNKEKKAGQGLVIKTAAPPPYDMAMRNRNPFYQRPDPAGHASPHGSLSSGHTVSSSQESDQNHKGKIADIHLVQLNTGVNGENTHADETRWNGNKSHGTTSLNITKSPGNSANSHNDDLEVQSHMSRLQLRQDNIVNDKDVYMKQQKEQIKRDQEVEKKRLKVMELRKKSVTEDEMRHHTENLRNSRENSAERNEPGKVKASVPFMGRRASSPGKMPALRRDSITAGYEIAEEDSIFMAEDLESEVDFQGGASDASSRSVTPPLPPLSPTNTPPLTPPDSPQMPVKYKRSMSACALLGPRPDLLKQTFETPKTAPRTEPKKKKVRTISMPGVANSQGKSSRPTPSVKKASRMSRSQLSGSLSDVKEDHTETEDGDGAMSTSQDWSEATPSPPVRRKEKKDNLPSKEVLALRNQLSGLETMYSEILRIVDQKSGKDRSEHGRHDSRRDSIAGSIVSQSSSHYSRGKKVRRSNSLKQRHKELKHVHKRFARLESHVVTLARSVAHLSSEMRSQNTLYAELDRIRQEIQEIRETPHLRQPPNGPGPMNPEDFERFRGWVPDLTNPKRVSKLTKFFGEEPPLLQMFLKRLGYERYTQNFDKEHVGMSELPYMNEERLKSLGIPMGPRLRILQEAQMCFRQENFNIYIV